MSTMKILSVKKVLLILCTCVVTLSRAEDGYFWQITDYHYDPTYGSTMRSCNDEVKEPGYYGNEWCDSSWGLVTDSLTSMFKIKQDVDFILWTGDSIPHIDDKFMNQEYILNIINNITDAIKSVFPNTAVYPTMGNNDWYLSDQLTPTSHPIYNNITEMWRSWISDQQLGNFRKGGFYTRKTTYNLRIVALNTNVYYFRDKLTANVSDPCGQFAWLDSVLGNAKKVGEKVLLTSHMPPGIHAPVQLQWFYDSFNTRFIDIILQYADIIVGFFCGHDHHDVLKLLKRGNSAIPIYVAPPLTPWRWKIPAKTGSPHYPAIRLIKYDRDTSLPLEIRQYYLNLTEANRRNVSDWKLEYTTKEEYDMPDLSANSLDTVLKKMETDESMLNKYIRFNTVWPEGGAIVDECGKDCRASIICSFRYFSKSEFESCRSSRVNSATRLCCTSFFILLAMCFGLLSR